MRPRTYYPGSRTDLHNISNIATIVLLDDSTGLISLHNYTPQVNRTTATWREDGDGSTIEFHSNGHGEGPKP
jgi:hypothetical protein